MNMRALVLVPILAVAACSSERQPPPQPAPRPQQRPAPAPPPPAPAPAPVGWADLPLTPGSWTYEGRGRINAAIDPVSSATYGVPGAPAFRIACHGPGRAVVLTRYGTAVTGTMAVRTSFGARSLPLTAGSQAAVATLPPRDPFVDSMIFSRGRFSVEVAGLPMLVIPAWPEPARVVEDCRR